MSLLIICHHQLALSMFLPCPLDLHRAEAALQLFSVLLGLFLTSMLFAMETPTGSRAGTGTMAGLKKRQSTWVEVEEAELARPLASYR